MGKAVVVSGGEIERDFLKELVKTTDIVVGADVGGEICLKFGIIPDVVVGDMDSIVQRTRKVLSGMGCEFKEFPKSKDKTDTLLAVEEAVNRIGHGEIFVVGALGKRIDHTLANLELLYPLRWEGVRVSIVDEKTRIFGFSGRCEISGRRGDTLSLFALWGPAKGVRSTGLKYPVGGIVFLPDFPIGVSNELVSEEASIEVDGSLLLVHYFSRQR